MQSANLYVSRWFATDFFDGSFHERLTIFRKLLKMANKPSLLEDILVSDRALVILGKPFFQSLIERCYAGLLGVSVFMDGLHAGGGVLIKPPNYDFCLDLTRQIHTKAHPSLMEGARNRGVFTFSL